MVDLGIAGGERPVTPSRLRIKSDKPILLPRSTNGTTNGTANGNASAPSTPRTPRTPSRGKTPFDGGVEEGDREMTLDELGYYSPLPDMNLGVGGRAPVGGSNVALAGFVSSFRPLPVLY